MFTSAARKSRGSWHWELELFFVFLLFSPAPVKGLSWLLSLAPSRSLRLALRRGDMSTIPTISVPAGNALVHLCYAQCLLFRLRLRGIFAAPRAPTFGKFRWRLPHWVLVTCTSAQRYTIMVSLQTEFPWCTLMCCLTKQQAHIKRLYTEPLSSYSAARQPLSTPSMLLQHARFWSNLTYLLSCFWTRDFQPTTT